MRPARLQTWKLSLVGLMFAVAIGVLGRAAAGQSLPPDAAAVTEDQPADAVTRQEARLLRWKFAPGNVLRYSHRQIETVRIPEGDRFDNERSLVYRWTVERVDARGTATIRVEFERVQFQYSWPELTYDSLADDPSRPITGPPQLRLLAYQARALAWSQFLFQVDTEGHVQILSGADALVGARQFTPGDMAALPDAEVAEGDGWFDSVDFHDSLLGHVRGNSAYHLSRVVRMGEQETWRIEGETEWFGNASVNGAVLARGPSAIEQDFDPATGRATRIASSQRLHVLTPQDTRLELTVFSERHLLGGSPLPSSTARPGEHAIDVDPDHSLIVTFCENWVDRDEDGQPVRSELVNANDRFLEGRPLQVLVVNLGTSSGRMHVEFVNSRGQQLFREPVAIGRESSFVVRELRGLQPDVYFASWFVDGRHVLRTPVQVVGRRGSGTNERNR